MTALLEAEEVVVDYARRRGAQRALDGVSLEVAAGETVGLVGESGSGKSTLGRAVLGLVPVTAGSIRFAGEDITRAEKWRRRELSSSMQVVFQDPYSSLNPTRTVGQTLAQPLIGHAKLTRAEIDDRVRAMLERVGLARDAADRYPSGFSGGQRQRIAIARALMISPAFVVCDEPLSALDLSIQAQIVNLLVDLRRELSLSYLFIAHDLPMVRYLADRVVVLYQGLVMESGGAVEVCDHPVHPYTRSLLAAIPSPDPSEQAARRSARSAIRSRDESRAPTLGGCPFVARCPLAVDGCRAERPPAFPRAGGGTVSCFRYEELQREAVAASARAAGVSTERSPNQSPVEGVQR